MVKFLIIRLDSFGELVMASPVVRCLKQQVRDCEVHFLTEGRFTELIAHNPYIDEVYDYSQPFSKLMEVLCDQGFDYVIDLQKNLRTQRIKNRLKLVNFSLGDTKIEKWILVNFKRNLLPHAHIVDYYMKTIALFAQNDGKGLDFFIPPQEKVNLWAFPFDKHQAFVAVILSAKYKTRRPTPTKLEHILLKIQHPIVLIGSEEDEELAQELTESIGSSCINTCGKYSILQIASILQQSTCVISGDNDFLAIASALKKDIISIWGNTVPEFGNAPYMAGTNSKILEVKGLKCRPCSRKGFTECPKGHFQCMTDIDSSYAAELTNRLAASIRYEI